MKKIFCSMLMILLTGLLIGCGAEKKSADVNQIPTEVATEENSDKPAQDNKKTPEPIPEDVELTTQDSGGRRFIQPPARRPDQARLR